MQFRILIRGHIDVKRFLVLKCQTQEAAIDFADIDRMPASDINSKMPASARLDRHILSNRRSPFSVPMNSVVSKRPRTWTSTPIHGSVLPDADAINPRISEAFRTLGKDDFSHRTHFFGGRYENLYLERKRIPELDLVLDHAEACARKLLDYDARPLRIGFWFNAQGPGQSTTEHTHEENDELLSGVYYVNVPQESGNLVLLDGALVTRVTPTAGSFFFFPPSLAHRVEINRSPFQRLSIAFNVGPGHSSE